MCSFSAFSDIFDPSELGLGGLCVPIQKAGPPCSLREYEDGAVCEMRMHRDFTSQTLVVVKFIYDRSCTSCDCDIILLLCS